MRRETGLDLVRSAAILFTISVHFFVNNGFYAIPVSSIRFIPQIFLRSLFYSCVPLFLLITGYLKKDKKLTKDYYKSIKRIIISYVFISIINLLFRKYYYHEIMGKTKFVLSIFNFTANYYAWYIEMYIGLFLLIPFLNILYNSLEDKKKKQILIITMLGLISISPVINYLKYKAFYLELIPNWWDNAYPILYYFIGAYIKDYKPHYDKKKLILILITTLSILTGILFLYNHNDFFSWKFFGGYNGITTVFTTTLVFLILYDINIKNKIISKIILSISALSLDMYLFSSITDSLVYRKLKIPRDITQNFKYYIIAVPASFALAYILSYIKRIIFERKFKF